MKPPILTVEPVAPSQSQPETFGQPNWLETPRTSWLLRAGLPLLCWRLSPHEKAIYLSFDDGPTRGVTDQILDYLREYHAKASFFCLGRSIEKAPEVFQRIISEGHSLGNHTFSHRSGWRSSLRDYLDDIARCDQKLPPLIDGKRPMFRPPYGELGLVQGLRIAISRRIVMWDLNSMDYREDQAPAEIARRVCQFARPGSIVLLHDSVETGSRTVQALPQILEELTERGYQFKAI